MADYISREAAYIAIVNNYTVDDQMQDLCSIPAADVAPVVHAHWEEKIIDDSNPLFRRRFYCSACRDWQTYGKTNHCPTCGARMDESEEEDNG